MITKKDIVVTYQNKPNALVEVLLESRKIDKEIVFRVYEEQVNYDKLTSDDKLITPAVLILTTRD